MITMKLCNLVVPLHFSYCIEVLTFWRLFFLFWCLCLAQGMRPKVEWNNFNSEWCVSFFFFICFTSNLLKKNLTSAILKLILVYWMRVTISQSHSLLSCFSCCVPTTPDPISKPWDSLRLTKVLLWFQLLFCKRKWMLGVFSVVQLW